MRILTALTALAFALGTLSDAYPLLVKRGGTLMDEYSTLLKVAKQTAELVDAEIDCRRIRCPRNIGARCEGLKESISDLTSISVGDYFAKFSHGHLSEAKKKIQSYCDGRQGIMHKGGPKPGVEIFFIKDFVVRSIGINTYITARHAFSRSKSALDIPSMLIHLASRVLVFSALNPTTKQREKRESDTDVEPKNAERMTSGRAQSLLFRLRDCLNSIPDSPGMQEHIQRIEHPLLDHKILHALDPKSTIWKDKIVSLIKCPFNNGKSDKGKYEDQFYSFHDGLSGKTVISDALKLEYDLQKP